MRFCFPFLFGFFLCCYFQVWESSANSLKSVGFFFLECESLENPTVISHGLLQRGLGRCQTSSCHHNLSFFFPICAEPVCSCTVLTRKWVTVMHDWFQNSIWHGEGASVHGLLPAVRRPWPSTYWTWTSGILRSHPRHCVGGCQIGNKLFHAKLVVVCVLTCRYFVLAVPLIVWPQLKEATYSSRKLHTASLQCRKVIFF